MYPPACPRSQDILAIQMLLSSMQEVYSGCSWTVVLGLHMFAVFVAFVRVKCCVMGALVKLAVTVTACKPSKSAGTCLRQPSSSRCSSGGTYIASAASGMTLFRYQNEFLKHTLDSNPLYFLFLRAHVCTSPRSSRLQVSSDEGDDKAIGLVVDGPELFGTQAISSGGYFGTLGCDGLRLRGEWRTWGELERVHAESELVSLS